MRKWNMRALASILFVGTAACGSGGSTGPDAPLDCSKVTGVDTFTVGLEKPGANGQLDFKLMSADPAPPKRNDNTWVVEIDQMQAGVAGQPMNGLTLTTTPYMPAHMHGTPIQAVATPSTMPGQYTITPINLWMPGIWQTTIAASEGSVNDQAVYTFCISD